MVKEVLIMHNIKSIFITLTLFTIIFQGCGSDNDSTQAYPTAIGESVSMVNNESNAFMAPSEQALKIVTDEIGNILKIHIVELNEKEATSFTKETNYCDVSGEKNLENSGNIETIVSRTEYKLCQNEQNSQDGTIEVSYLQNNNDGKFPQALMFSIQELYTFNKIIFKENVVIKGNNIRYDEEGSLKSIDLDISGNIEYNYQTLILKNLEQTINF